MADTIALAPVVIDRTKQKTSSYRVLGEGSSLAINLVSIAGFLGLRWAATHLGWIKPLFLPKPESIWLAFQQAVNGDLDGHTLGVHFLWSIYRVFSTFALAVLRCLAF